MREGVVWATRSDDTADYWLEAGHALRLRRGERLWLGAECDAARIAFEMPARAGERVMGWLARAAAPVLWGGRRRVRQGWRSV